MREKHTQCIPIKFKPSIVPQHKSINLIPTPSKKRVLAKGNMNMIASADAASQISDSYQIKSNV